MQGRGCRAPCLSCRAGGARPQPTGPSVHTTLGPFTWEGSRWTSTMRSPTARDTAVPTAFSSTKRPPGTKNHFQKLGAWKRSRAQTGT